MKKKHSTQVNYQLDYKLLQIPGLIVIFIIFFVPMVLLIYYSTLQYKMSDPGNVFFIGIDNYIEVFKNNEFKNSIIVTLKYIIYALAIETPLALLLMEVINCFKKGAEFIKACFLPPMVIPPIVSGLIWRMMYQPSTGVLNYFLSFIGLAPEWLTSSRTAMLSIIIVDVWAYTPFLLIILLSGRAAISQDYYEAAMLDGANRMQCFFNVTLPQLTGCLMVGLLLRMTDCLKVFPSIHILTAGGPGISTQTINYYTYRQAFNYGMYGYASALGLIMLCFSFILSSGIALSFIRMGRNE